METTFGSAALRGHVPGFSDEVVRRIEAAGMVSIGKTNAPEFGAPCYTEPDVAPPARTPYDLSRSAGGSSGGAAAAVAGGLLPVAHGSDGGGSIRIPASVTGLVGFKPSRGRISPAPLYADVTGLSTSGPLAGTVRDSAAFLDVMAGPSVTDASWAPGSARRRQLPRLVRAASRGGCGSDASPTPMIADVVVDPEVLAAYDAMAERLAGLGHVLVEAPMPFDQSIVPTFETVWSVMTASWPLPDHQEQELRPLTRWLRERGARVSGPAFSGALVAMRQAAAGALAALAEYDAVLTPTLAQLPALVGAIRDDDDPAQDFENQKAFTPFTAAWNVTGMPAVSLPTGWSETGLPIGTMLAGKPGHDHVLYALAAQVEASIEPGPRGVVPPRVAAGLGRLQALRWTTSVVGLRPRFRDGDFRSGARWPMVMAPIGVYAGGTPNSVRNASQYSRGTPKKHAPSPSSVTVCSMSRAAIPVSMSQ